MDRRAQLGEPSMGPASSRHQEAERGVRRSSHARPLLDVGTLVPGPDGAGRRHMAPASRPSRNTGRGNQRSVPRAAAQSTLAADGRAHPSQPDQLQASLDSLLAASQKASTRASYAAAVAMFRKFWSDTRQSGPAFPLHDDSLLMFVAWLDLRGVKATTAQQYVSAVRHTNALQTGAGADRKLELAFRGMTNKRAESQGTDPLKPAWLPEWTVKAADMLSELLSTPRPSLSDVQALATSILGFLLAQRASSLVALRAQDLTASSTFLQVREQTRKTKGATSVHIFEIPVEAGSAASMCKFVKFMSMYYKSLRRPGWFQATQRQQSTRHSTE